jgi:Peptidase M15
VRRGRGLALIAFAVLVGVGAYVALIGIPTGWSIGGREPGRIWQVDVSPLDAVRREEFDAWLAAEPGRAREFAGFEAFIAREGFADLLPAWTLLRANANKSARCSADPFVLPPRALWRNILPALRLVRDKVIPAVGPVVVASAFRDPALNVCSGGAAQSRHLSFHALDLIPVMRPPTPDHFAKLCAAWRAAGRGSRWGLGAYHDPAKPNQNEVGRFHVDGAGWRTWGFDYTRTSSRCNSA